MSGRSLVRVVLGVTGLLLVLFVLRVPMRFDAAGVTELRLDSGTLEPRVLWQHDHGQRQHLAVPDRRAEALSSAFPQRMPIALPHPGLRRYSERPSLADRQRGGYLAAPVDITALGNQALLGLAERADMIVDFANVPVGNYVLGNVGPDDPFGGGIPGVDFDSADPLTTGQIMQFNVVPALAPDATTLPQNLILPPIVPPPPETVVRPLALIEKMGMGYDADGMMVDGPVEAVLGTVEAGSAVSRLWMEPVTENPAVGATEIWEFYNTTGDAHPMHVHEVVFEVVNREGLFLDANGDPEEPLTPDGVITPPEPWETGFKDTVTA